jgi:hypothetical protein
MTRTGLPERPVGPVAPIERRGFTRHDRVKLKLIVWLLPVAAAAASCVGQIGESLSPGAQPPSDGGGQAGIAGGGSGGGGRVASGTGGSSITGASGGSGSGVGDSSGSGGAGGSGVAGNGVAGSGVAGSGVAGTSGGAGSGGRGGTGGGGRGGTGVAGNGGRGGTGVAGSGGRGGTGGGIGGTGGDPFTVAPTCTSRVTTAETTRGSPDMNPGRACITCHTTNRGPTLTIGGTIYPTAHEPDLCNGANGTNGARVIIVGADGQTQTLTPGTSGNFNSRTRVTTPYRASVTYMGRERAMTATQTSGDCNACHTQNGTNGAPGRILLP